VIKNVQISLYYLFDLLYKVIINYIITYILTLSFFTLTFNLFTI